MGFRKSRVAWRRVEETMSDDAMAFLSEHKAKVAQIQASALVAQEQAQAVCLMKERMDRIEAKANAPYVRPPGELVLCTVCYDCPCACNNNRNTSASSAPSSMCRSSSSMCRSSSSMCRSSSSMYHSSSIMLLPWPLQLHRSATSLALRSSGHL